MIVFSFSLYGDQDKYTKGMVRNCDMIKERFPDAIVYIYIASDVPSFYRELLASYSNVKLIPVERNEGSSNMYDRFLTIDDESTDIMFVRDADSRVHERDACCIEDFIKENKALHIIRDNKNHNRRIMGGMFGIRKSLFPYSMANLIKEWQQTHTDINTRYGSDQRFLADIIYPRFKNSMLVHDRYHCFKEEDVVPFRYPIVDHLFIGQVHYIIIRNKILTEIVQHKDNT